MTFYNSPFAHFCLHPYMSHQFHGNQLYNLQTVQHNIAPQQQVPYLDMSHQFHVNHQLYSAPQPMRHNIAPQPMWYNIAPQPMWYNIAPQQQVPYLHMSHQFHVSHKLYSAPQPVPPSFSYRHFNKPQPQEGNMTTSTSCPDNSASPLRSGYYETPSTVMPHLSDTSQQIYKKEYSTDIQGSSDSYQKTISKIDKLNIEMSAIEKKIFFIKDLTRQLLGFNAYNKTLEIDDVKKQLENIVNNISEMKNDDLCFLELELNNLNIQFSIFCNKDQNKQNKQLQDLLKNLNETLNKNRNQSSLTSHPVLQEAIPEESRTEQQKFNEFIELVDQVPAKKIEELIKAKKRIEARTQSIEELSEEKKQKSGEYYSTLCEKERRINEYIASFMPKMNELKKFVKSTDLDFNHISIKDQKLVKDIEPYYNAIKNSIPNYNNSISLKSVIRINEILKFNKFINLINEIINNKAFSKCENNLTKYKNILKENKSKPYYDSIEQDYQASIKKEMEEFDNNNIPQIHELKEFIKNTDFDDMLFKCDDKLFIAIKTNYDKIKSRVNKVDKLPLKYVKEIYQAVKGGKSEMPAEILEIIGEEVYSDKKDHPTSEPLKSKAMMIHEEPLVILS